MEYLFDTVTIIRHFSGMGKIGKRAKDILDATEMGKHHLYISTISLVEIMYLSEKNRIMINLGETLKLIHSSINYSIVDLKSDIIQIAEYIQVPDIFDRLIVATAKYLDIPILTSDKMITDKRIVDVIWE